MAREAQNRRDRMRARMLSLLGVALTIAVGAADNAWASAPTVRGSVQQVDVTGAKVGSKLVLLGRTGKELARRPATSLGAAIFRHVAPGPGYRVKTGKSE